jgi:hypothetical protein
VGFYKDTSAHGSLNLEKEAKNTPSAVINPEIHGQTADFQTTCRHLTSSNSARI